MNNQAFERRLQQLDAPAPDPEARLRARRAAVREFEHLQQEREPGSTRRGWLIPAPWLGGFVTAGLAIVGVSLYWLMPETDRAIAPTAAPVAQAIGAQESASVSATVAAEAGQPDPPAMQESPSPQAPPTADVGAKAAEPVPTEDSSRADSPVEAGAADRNMIPSSLLDRKDVVTNSASINNGTLLAENGGRPQVPNRSSAGPTATITSEEMQRLGIVNVADALKTLVPQDVSDYRQAASAVPPTPGAPPAPFTIEERAQLDRGAFIVGNTIANLRGLDPTFGNRTLTLIDGRRVALPADQQATPPGNDRFAQFAVNPVKRTVDEPESTFSIDVDTAAYSYVRRQLNSGELPSANAVRTEEMINYFDYNWPAAGSRDAPFKPTVTVSDSPWNEGRKLVHIGIKGYELPARQRPDVNLVLLLDVSGSMNSPDKLPLAQSALAMLLDSLKPTDTVGIAVYAGAAGEVLPPTPVSQKQTILDALYRLRAGGSTAGAEGVQLAYEMAARSFREEGVNRIVLATDGDFNVGISDVNELKRFVEQQRQRGIFLSVLGFGQGNYRDDVAQALAQNGNGVAAYIDSVNEARKVLVEQAGSQLFTIAKDVKIQVEFNPETVAEYRLVGYETRALNREDFNNDKVDAGDIGAGHTVTAMYEITPVDAAARSFDQRRYGPRDAAPAPRGRQDEYGFVKIRYKQPDQDNSRLIEQPIAVNAGVPRALREDVAFSTAVAGFAQLLQGGQYSGQIGYDDVFRQAQGAMGEDPHGYRAEFLQLVRRAQGIVGR